MRYWVQVGGENISTRHGREIQCPGSSLQKLVIRLIAMVARRASLVLKALQLAQGARNAAMAMDIADGIYTIDEILVIFGIVVK